MEGYLSISFERYEQLIRAEHEANKIKSLISEKYENFENINRDDLKLLHAMYCNKKEEE